MSLNKQKGNMYEFVTHTWNPIGGRCPHQCNYCFMRGRWPAAQEFREGYLRDSLGEGRTIFVGSSTDMWADAVPDEWIRQVLERCNQSSENRYLFQSKNPNRFFGFWYPLDVILGTTLESNRDYGYSKAPIPSERLNAMRGLVMTTMVSIEPIMDFDLTVFVEWIRAIQPEFVSIGADSRGHNLPEPSGEKVQTLIAALEKFTEVRPKKNLERLMEG